MRSLCGLVLAAGVLTLAAGCGKNVATTGGSGYPTPDGAYLITSMEMEGEKLPEDHFARDAESERAIKFSGNTMTTNKGGKDNTIDVMYDTSKTPAHITTTETMPSGKTETANGIYKIEGDTLTICMAKGGEGKDGERPKEFKTVKGGTEFLITLKKK
jgi:uncharacterized protein (TIGR03067 family)